MLLNRNHIFNTNKPCYFADLKSQQHRLIFSGRISAGDLERGGRRRPVDLADETSEGQSGLRQQQVVRQRDPLHLASGENKKAIEHNKF
jgi:hypothetical protein